METRQRERTGHGERTLGKLLKTAMQPVGTTLYLYGGGWNEADTGAATQARTLGPSPEWERFFRAQDERFDYRAYRDRRIDVGGLGLDCSGYLGWVLYNTLETENGREGYVMPAERCAKWLAERGFGTWTQAGNAPVRPGDVVSVREHVWLSLGACGDGSVLILHSTPAVSRSGCPGGGVELSAVGSDEGCAAYRLAERYMEAFYPLWYARYPVKLADPAVYLRFVGEDAGRFSWDTAAGALTDPDGLQDMAPEAVLSWIKKL